MKPLLDMTLRLSRSAEARSAAGYLTANVLASFIPLLLLPVFTRVMTPEAYGQYSLFLLVISVSMPLVTLMFSSVVTREYLLRDNKGFAGLLSSAFALQFLGFIILSALCYVLAPHVESLLKLPVNVVFLGFIFAAAQGILLIMQGICTIQKKPRSYMAWRLGFAFSCGAAAYVVITASDGNWHSLAQSQAVVALCAIIIALIVSAKKGWLTRKLPSADTKLLMVYSSPLILHALTASVIVQNADRFFISHYMTLADVGSYNVAQQISLAMYVVINSLNQAWNPWYYEQMKQGSHDAKARIVRFTYIGFAGLLFMGVAAASLLWLAYPYVVGAEFQSGREIFPWLILGFVFNGMYVLISSGMFYSGHTFQLMLCNLVVAAINIALNFTLVPVYGMHGAATATVLSTLCMLLLVWGATARLHRLPWRLKTQPISEMDSSAHG